MNKLIIVTIVLIGVVALFAYLNTQKANLFNHAKSVFPTPRTAAITGQSHQTVTMLTIKNNTLIDGPKTLQVAKDKMVVLQITADDDDELSLSGYNKHVFLQKGRMVVLSFLATILGNFSYQLEKTKTILGNIQVSQ